jgi:hypothetical protein
MAVVMSRMPSPDVVEILKSTSSTFRAKGRRYVVQPYRRSSRAAASPPPWCRSAIDGPRLGCTNSRSTP